MDANSSSRKTIIMISGKRTCGKDTLAQEIFDLFLSNNESVYMTSFAKALKRAFCRDTGYEFNKMMNDYSYKEERRDEMTNYFIKMRKEEGEGFFSNELLKEISERNENHIIVSDLRLMHDLTVFKNLPTDVYKLVTIRVNATIETRKNRGWVEKPCDTEFTETDLDNYNQFDIVVNNDNSVETLKITIKYLLRRCHVRV